MTDLYIAQLPTGTIDNLQAVFPLEIGMPGSPQTIRADLYQTLQFAGMNGAIRENSAQLTYITGTSYRVEAGLADVNGTLLAWSSPITRSGLALTSGTMNYVYLYSNAGTAALEESTTAPVWDATLNYYKKTGDNSRRCIGFLQAQTVSSIRPFLNIVYDRLSEFWYIDGNVAGGTATIPVNSGNSGFPTGTAWMAVTPTAAIPVHAQGVLLVVKALYLSAVDEVNMAVSPWDLGASVPVTGNNPYSVRARTNNAGSHVFFGNTWMMLKVPQTFYYKMGTISGDPRAQIQIQGVRIVR